MTHTDTPTAADQQHDDGSWWTRLRRTLADLNSREDYGTKLYP
jgi:hypothetical protein